MSKNELKMRTCKVCGKKFEGRCSYCSLECLHSTNRCHGSYEEKRKILDYMLEHPDESSRSIAKLFGVSKSVTERLSFFTDRRREIIDVNEDYFEVIDTEDKAYWLGFLYADGYVKKRKGNSCTVEVCLAEIDREHLEKLKSALNSDSEIRRKMSKCDGKEFISYRFSVHREKMYNDLVEKGCIENKSLKLTFPNIDIFENKDLVKHFIRGYVDGDGSLGIYGDKRIPNISILGTFEFLNGVLEWLKTDGNIETKANVIRCTSKGKENIFQIGFSSRNAHRAISYLYEDSSIYLDRKYDKYLQIKDIYKDVL